ncbi:MAG: acyltransferase family protein [Eubacteriales bacterium]|nr:acyltransferase family protein [Eubacteriales bacterium]
MRRANLDLCRVIACLAVAAVHTVMLFWDSPPASPTWAVWNLLSLAGRFSVPLFFMISGALLLGRERLDFRRHLRRILHIVLLFYVWSAVCRCLDAACGRVWMDGTPLGLLILQGYFHLWFLPALALCYCALPLLHAAIHGGADNLRRGALLLFGVVLALAVLDAVPDKPAWLSALLSPWRLSHLRYLLYLLLGWLLTRGTLSDRALTALGLAALASLLLTAFLNRRAALAAGEAVDVYYGNFTLSAALGACFVFALCRRLAPRAEKHAGLLHKLSGCTLGLYLMHPILIDLLRGRVDFAAHSAVWLFPASYLAAVLIPLGLTLLLKKLPLLNKLVT